MTNGSNQNYIQVLNSHSDGHGIHITAVKPGADDIEIYAGGNITLVADNVGVGYSTTAPSYKLEVNGTAYVHDDFSVKDSAGTGTSLFVDKSANRVGINKSSPGYALDVGGQTFSSTGFVTSGIGDYYNYSPTTGTGNDAEWVYLWGFYYLARNSSVREEKENESTNLGQHLTPEMVDNLPVTMFNRKTAPNVPEIGLIAEDADAISPFLAAHGMEEDGSSRLTGINKTGWMSLLTIALQDVRERLAALEA